MRFGVSSSKLKEPRHLQSLDCDTQRPVGFRDNIEPFARSLHQFRELLVKAPTQFHTSASEKSIARLERLMKLTGLALWVYNVGRVGCTNQRKELAGSAACCIHPG